jgi:hypothetical protein
LKRVQSSAGGRETHREEARRASANQSGCRPRSRQTLDRACLLTLSAVLMVGATASAETLTGTVKNGTTNKPAAGDDVVLIKLASGMEEVARTKADSKGKFSFNVPDDGPHLLRAIHQEVTYHRMAPPGTTSVEVEVFDVAKKLEGITVTADVMRFQAQGDRLQGVRLLAINNNSSPRRTQMSDQNFEFYLPDGAQIDQSMAKTEGGQPVNSAPVPQHEKNRYAFVFPLRPGTTQFQVSYHLAYSGKLAVDPKTLYATQHFVAMVPKSMQFTPGPGTSFQSMQDPQQSDAVVQVVSNTQAGEPLNFTISGTGALAEETGGGGDQGGTAQASGAMGGGPGGGRPGGGLGPPIDAPDPLEKFRWYILGGFALVLAGGAVYIAKRPKIAEGPDFGPADVEISEPPPVAKPAPKPRPTAAPSAGPAQSANMLLEALKEEMFQLELEHKQGKITQQEYEKTKAAMDQTLERALKRGAARQP